MEVQKHSIDKIRALLGLKKYPPERPGYTGIYLTGRFDQLYDYEAGLLQVNISYNRCGEGYCARFSLVTIDDGGWVAWDVESLKTEKEAAQRVEQIKDHFLELMGGGVQLPTEKVLNDHLMLIGLWGRYES